MLSLSKHGGQASAHALRQAQGDSPVLIQLIYSEYILPTLSRRL